MKYFFYRSSSCSKVSWVHGRRDVVPNIGGVGCWSLSTGYTMRDSPVDSVPLLHVVGFCVKSARKSSSLHSNCIGCDALPVKDFKSRRTRTSRIKCHGRTGCSVDSVKEKPTLVKIAHIRIRIHIRPDPYDLGQILHIASL